MRHWLALAAAPFLLSASDPTIDAGWPPLRFQGDGQGVIGIVFSSNVNAACGTAPQGYLFVGCVRKSEGDIVLILPNACQPQFRSETYARIVCHEAAHLGGWPASHGP